MKKNILTLIACSVGYVIQAQESAIKAYNNYDFVSGEKILFEDNFLNDKKGEFPSHWNLKSGQAVDNNTTPEGKANNRRVEFLKK